MSGLQKALIAIIFVLGCVYMFRPPVGYQVEVARRPKITPTQAKQTQEAYVQKWKQNQEALQQRKVEEQARKKAEQEALKRAEEEKLMAERAEADRLNRAMQMAAVRAASTPVPQPAGRPIATRAQMAASMNQQNGQVRTAAAVPVVAAKPEAVVTTIYKTRYLYLRLKNSILKFDVVKSLTEPQLDSLTRVLGSTCLASQSMQASVGARCKKTVTVDRSFAAASRTVDGGALGWTLECVGSVQDCTDPSKASQLILTSIPKSGTVTLAHGFDVQIVGRTPASKTKPSVDEVLQVEKVYVTRNMK